ncbi:MAG TPA: hypothetical protein VHC69_13345 [Polyangiaceae bacterium]|nr:hypothetical protein [Polyangiaceae bacterium]
MSHRMLDTAFGILCISQAVACDTVTEQTQPRSPVQEQIAGSSPKPLTDGTMDVAVVPHAPGAKSSSVDAACAGISAQDREIGPFGDRSQITSVSPLVETMTQLKFSWSQLRGAMIFMRATPGTTKQWLNRLGYCHMSSIAGSVASGADGVADPFAVAPVDMTVEDTPQGFVVYIRTRQVDTDLAKLVLEASKRLLPNR